MDQEAEGQLKTPEEEKGCLPDAGDATGKSLKMLEIFSGSFEFCLPLARQNSFAELRRAGPVGEVKSERKGFLPLGPLPPSALGHWLGGSQVTPNTCRTRLSS